VPILKKVPVYDSTSLGIPIIFKLKELIRYRHLVWNLILRDLKVRYKRSVIGFIWVLLNPLIMMGALVFVFSAVYQTQIKQFSTYVLSGLLLWNLMSQGSVAALSSIQMNSATIKRIYVPPSAFVVSVVGSALVNTLFALIPFFLLAMMDGLMPQPGWLFLIVPILQAAIFTCGLGLLVSVLVVFFADVFEIYLVLLNAFFFLTPIMYPVSILSPTMRALQLFNPMFYIITSFRTIVLENRVPSLDIIITSTLLSIIGLVIGWICFAQAEDQIPYLM
jgi:ABC-type polysaccharide/polyol phosphate export permease